jgi:hypothetical protein
VDWSSRICLFHCSVSSFAGARFVRYLPLRLSLQIDGQSRTAGTGSVE